MEKATEVLSEEHKHILKVVHALEKECAAIEAGRKLDKLFFEKALGFIKNYADSFHHAKEEDILFKELCREDVVMPCNPVQQMLFEHETGRNYVKGMEEGVKENNKERVAENARGYAQLLKDHIYKEDNILYPMADNALSSQVQKSVLERFKKAEQKKFGKGTREKYLRIAEELEKRKQKESK